MTARGVIGSLLGFTLAGVVLAVLLGRALPDDWGTSAFVAVGLVGAFAAGAAGGLAGGWFGTPAGAIGGAALGALLLIAAQPQADLVTLLSLLAVVGGAAATALTFSGRSSARRRRGSRRGSARSPLRA
ncbi:hypothetical protein OM076_40680 [Solirubrobacter ginsenosidimutans]|uniref:Uncharacterized protein n=1 Tax=Solirubrobacter ginsenosidimutans TaxID=490573 RepID=A0A9X3SB64_9ACTN|nr:hypothetical protein [Solirubrobacter ginsenosidimutans]MDA0166648.1 hypothetical protein [Solirubrobacter ginsenosidimutans]